MAEMVTCDRIVDSVGTPAGTENEITEAVCKGCSKLFKPGLLYRCNTCVGASVSSTDYNIVEYFCRLCVVSFHLKQKHEIIDERGYRPAICEDHENICNLFCKDCVIVICNCCVDDHSTHILGSVSEKEIEVRKEIFELITKNEVLSKPLKEKQRVTNEVLANLSQVVDALKPENIADTLCRKFETAIRANCETWVKEYLRIPEDALKGYQNCQSEAESLSGVLERADEAMLTMRDMLKTSGGVCVDRYLKCRKELKSSLVEQDDFNKKVFHLKECKKIDEIIEESVIEAFKQIRIPVFSTGCKAVTESRDVTGSKDVTGCKYPPGSKVVTGRKYPPGCEDPPGCKDATGCVEILKLKPVGIYRSFRNVNYGCGHVSSFRGIRNVPSDFIRINLHPDCLILRVLKENDGKFTEEQISLEPRDVSTVRRHGNYAALRGRDDQLAIVDLSSGAIFRCSPISPNIFDLLYFACCSVDTFILVLWLRGALVKKFYSLKNRKPLRSYEVKCVSYPKCVAGSPDLIVFVDQRNHIIIVQEDDHKKVIVIQSAEHQMSQIDKLMFMQNSTLVLFDYKERKIVTLKITDTGGLMKWQVANAVKVSLPCSDQVTEFGFFNDSKLFALINDNLFAQ